MTYEEAMDMGLSIVGQLRSGSTVTIRPTSENIEFLSLCAESAGFQEPRKPKITIYNAFCPQCDYSFGAEVAMDAIKRPYWHRNCPVCGQTIDWSEVE